MTKDLYTAHSHVTGGRDGRAVSDDGQLDLPLAFPKALGGSGNGTNPEQLFSAGFAGCFASSIVFSAKSMNLDAGAVEVDAEIVLVLGEDGRYGLKGSLAAHVPGLTGDDLDRVMTEAKRVCAYTNATRGNVDLTIGII